MRLTGFSEDHLGKMEDSLRRRISDPKTTPTTEVEVFVELDQGEGTEGEIPDNLDTLDRKTIEEKLGISLPSEASVVRWYGFMNTLVLSLPAGSIPDLFESLPVKKMSDSIGDIKPASDGGDPND